MRSGKMCGLAVTTIKRAAITPGEFGAYFKREIDKYAKVIQASGARVD